MITNDTTYSFIKQGLDASSLRSKVIANNISNINTAGYKKFKVAFEENLKSDGKLDVNKTRNKHMDINNSQSTISVVKDESSSMREDGNNVDLDLEKVNQAANTLMYNALITQANNKLSQSNYVISGGR